MDPGVCPAGGVPRPVIAGFTPLMALALPQGSRIIDRSAALRPAQTEAVDRHPPMSFFPLQRSHPKNLLPENTTNGLTVSRLAHGRFQHLQVLSINPRTKQALLTARRPTDGHRLSRAAFDGCQKTRSRRNTERESGHPTMLPRHGFPSPFRSTSAVSTTLAVYPSSDLPMCFNRTHPWGLFAIERTLAGYRYSGTKPLVRCPGRFRLCQNRALTLCAVSSSVKRGGKHVFVSRMVSRARVRPSARSFFTPDSGQVLAPDTTGASE
jgi:hypothetical protein